MNAKIIEVATKTRAWAELEAKKRHMDPSLMGLCGVASAKLHNDLKEAGIKSEIVVNDSESHVFVLVDETVVDVTATQFNNELPKVYIDSIEEIFSEVWNEGRIFYSAEELVFYQKNSGWPNHQIAEMK